MDYLDIVHKLKFEAQNDGNLYALIGDRFRPQLVQLNEELVFPLISFHLLTSSPNRDQYPVKTYLFQTNYVSESSLDEANKVYTTFYDIINNNRYNTDLGNFVIKEDNGITDASGIYGKRYLYVLSNLWIVRKIGA